MAPVPHVPETRTSFEPRACAGAEARSIASTAAATARTLWFVQALRRNAADRDDIVRMTLEQGRSRSQCDFGRTGPAQPPLNPSRSAQRAACVRSVTPSSRKIRVRCDLTVFSLISSRRAISLLGRPSTQQRRAPHARAADSAASGSGSVRASSTVRAARGSRGDSPRAAARMPSATSSEDDVLEQVAAGARPRARPGSGGRSENDGQHEHRDLGSLGSDRAGLPRCRPRAASRGPSARRRASCSRAQLARPPRRRRRSADELDVVEPIDQPPEAVADDAVVVGEQDADHRGGHLQLDRSCPRPGAESTASVPSASRTRSSSSVRPRWPSSQRVRSRGPAREAAPVVFDERAATVPGSGQVDATPGPWMRRRGRCTLRIASRRRGR